MINMLEVNENQLLDQHLRNEARLEEQEAERKGDRRNMIIDMILDRKYGVQYDVCDFYHYVREYEDIFKFDPDISIAFDYGAEDEVKQALKNYILKQGYNEKINEYIDSVDWVD